MADAARAAALERIRHRARNSGDLSDVGVLLKAVEAALKLADKYDAESERLWGQIRDADRLSVKSGSKVIDAAWNGDAAEAIREAIARELTGEPS